MIIYSGTKGQFVSDVRDNLIANKIEKAFARHHIFHNNPSEHRSWANSLQFMRNVIDVPEINDDCQVAIEYQIPLTSKRVDFMLAGKDKDDKSNVIIVELKQWDNSEEIKDLEGVVQAYTGGASRQVPHPSYQAYSYAKIIEDFNSSIGVNKIHLRPCAYLHNYPNNNKSHIDNAHYRAIIKSAPLFLEDDTVKLRKFIEKFVVRKDDEDLLMLIDHGKLKPSKALQDTIRSLMDGNEEFFLIDEQKVAYERILRTIRECVDTENKHTIIVRGGPGTGKSVIAVQLLAQLIKAKLSAAYVTKNSAPRNVYSKELVGSNYRKSYVQHLFVPSGSFVAAKRNEFDVLICDEAHRLNERSGLYHNQGVNQAGEIIHASKVSVFFIDEDQRVTTSDYGTVDMIKDQARKEHSAVIDDPDSLTLVSQFRCNGSDGYLAFLDDLLGIRKISDDIPSFDYDLRLFSSPTKLREELRKKNSNNKSRMVAGYCYEWKSKKQPDVFDIELEDGNFKAQWNLNNTTTWAIDPDSFEQVGCIHTCQGLEFDYVGVIVGKDLIYDANGGEVMTDYTKRAKSDQSLKGIRKSGDTELADRIIRNTYRVLLSRGQKGCFIYCEDEDLLRHIAEVTGREIID